MSVYREAITHFCYRLTATMPYDPEDIWADIQGKDGYLSIGRAGDVLFYVAAAHSVFFVLKYPELERVSDKDML